MINPNILALKVSEISPVIRTDGQTDRRTWLDDSASDPDQEYGVGNFFSAKYIIYILYRKFFCLPVTYFPINLVRVYPALSTSNGYKKPTSNGYKNYE